MHNRIILFLVGLIILGVTLILLFLNTKSDNKFTSNNPFNSPSISPENANPADNFTTIEMLRKRSYPASDLIIEETLEPGANYSRLIASYLSDGLKIYGLLTIPDSPKPEKGFPVVVFLHGFVNPRTYVTTADYVASQDDLARAGFVTFKPDFRGHGKSQGQATGAHFSNDYVIDTLNAISSLKTNKEVDPEKIGLWGHSNGGETGLRTLVVSSEIKAAVFWAGVVGSFRDMLETYNDKIPFLRRQTSEIFEKYGSPSANPDFWKKLDPFAFLEDISAPLELHHGTVDSQVPVELSQRLAEELEKRDKTVEFYQYPGGDHNLQEQDFGLAMSRTITFFKKFL